jgi:1,4-dihydroxy-2-naphthoyl-CoA hydrolase
VDYTPPVPFEQGFDAAYGLEMDLERAISEGVVTASVAVREELLAEHGAVHGGVLAALAEATASTGTWVVASPKGLTAMGLSNDTTVTAPVREGVIRAEARAVTRGDDAWVWAVEARDDGGEVVAFSRITVAVRPMRG